MPPHVLLIDNYDSFTHNLYRYLGALGARVEVVRNDSLDIETILGGPHTHIVIGPGSGVPSNTLDFGVCGAVIDQVLDRPVLGVCLGHQAIVEHLGGRVIQAPRIMHGKVDTVRHDGRGLFEDLSSPLEVKRYHSWVVEEASFPAELEITARDDAGLIMALRHRKRPLLGVQFHPENVGAPTGPDLLANFLALTTTGAEGPAPIQIRVPSSKSITHRAFLLAARSAVPCVVRDPLLGQDCLSTLSVLKKLGARFEVRAGDVCFDPIDGWKSPTEPLDCGNSGTTLRLFTGQAATLEGPSTLSGDSSLQARPNEALLTALRSLGAHVEDEGGSQAPLTVRGPLRGRRVELPSGCSSQFASSLILASALADTKSTRLVLARPVASRPYLKITEAVAAKFGIRFLVLEDETNLTFEIPGRQLPSASTFEVEGDWSGAAFGLTAAAILGRRTSLSGLRRNSTQGDERIVALIARFGQWTHWQGDLLQIKPGPIMGAGEVDLGAAPDLFCALVALAAVAEGETRFVNTPSLRHKECDRIAVMAEGLRRLSISVEERSDGLSVVGGPLGQDARIETHGDHRVHMAFALLNARAGNIQLDGQGCEAVSYPTFYEDLQKFRA